MRRVGVLFAVAIAVGGIGFGAAAAPAAEIVSISVLDAKVKELDAARRVVFVLRLSDRPDAAVTVRYTTKNGSAVAGTDYTTVRGVARFGAGQTSLPITVRVAGDRTYEQDEIFFLDITAPSANAQISDPEGAASVLNDDPVPRISVTDSVAAEKAGIARFSLRLTNPSAFPVSVNWRTADVTAKAGTDYVSVVRDVTFRRGQTALPITVRVVRDSKGEARERFAVVLCCPFNATIADKRGVALISDTPPGQ